MKIEKIFKAGVCFAAASGLFVPHAFAKEEGEPEPVRLSPSSKWHVDFADDSCRLARFFGEGDQRTLFYIERYEPGDAFSMVVAGEPLKRRRYRDKIVIRFGKDTSEDEIAYTIGSVGEQKPAIIFSNLRFDLKPLAEGDESERLDQPDIFGQEIPASTEAGIESIMLQHKGRVPVILETGSLGDPMKVLRDCTDNMLQYWGIDLEKHRTIAQLPEPRTSPGRWLSYRDYPSDLLQKGYQGYVQVRLSVDANGKPTDCHIQQSTRPEGFDAAVCKGLMRKARFKPAITQSGEAISSYWRTAVRFAIPS
ncbi:energy transducer TonB [Pontixanthobacter aquaemixtae]|uniref:TonB family protein n=1 Tax=Pontixanthobacter aquaemixtae TaxID=1958940 RepID=A0A844ZX43_9SPHN|nr:energy transducer TonB [Pontixanthobacter aquaemixtae]MXO91327.1 TonB family protein [Pontixanthobacter aquaemixtae]